VETLFHIRADAPVQEYKCPFIISMKMAVLSHSKPASIGKYCDTCRGNDRNRRTSAKYEKHYKQKAWKNGKYTLENKPSNVQIWEFFHSCAGVGNDIYEV
jgi:hypothetical protein